MEPGGGADAYTVLQRPLDRFQTVIRHRLATALLGGSTQAGEDALADHRPFKFGEDPQHPEHRPTAWRAGVEALLVEVEVHALGLDVAEEADQIGKAAAKPIDGPRGDHVEVAPGHTLQKSVKAGAFVAALGAADALVDESGGDDPSLPPGDLLKLLKLILDGLVIGRDPRVDRHFLQAVLPPPLVRGIVSRIGVQSTNGREISYPRRRVKAHPTLLDEAA